MSIPALSVPITADDAALTAAFTRAKAAVSSFSSTGLGDLDAFDRRMTAMAGNLRQKMDFAQILDRSGKSAKDSAAAFDELMSAQEATAKSAAAIRAQIDPLGAAQARLNAQMAEYAALAAAGAISTREQAAAATLAQKAYEDQARGITAASAAAREAAAAQTAKQSAQNFVNKQTVSPDRGADVAAYGQQLDQLRAKYNPLYAAGQQYRASLTDLNQAHKVGAISELEYGVALTTLKTGFVGQVASIKESQNALGGHTNGMKLNAMQGMELVHVGRSVVDQMVAGVPITRALAVEGGRLAQVFSMGQGGVSGTLKAAASTFASFVTPVRLAGAGIAAAAALAIYSYTEWEAAQQKLLASTQGVGRRSGVGIGDLNSIAATGAAAGGISRSSAQDLAGTFNATGQISGDLSAGLIASAKAYARVTGQDLSDAGAELAKAFADPSKGADMLNEKLGFLDDKTRQLILTQQASMDIMGAQRTLFDAYSRDIQNAADHTTALARVWDTAKTSASNFFGRIGESVAQKIAPTDDYQLAELTAQRQELDHARGFGVQGKRSALDAQIAPIQRRVDAAQDAADDQADDMVDAEKSRKASDAVRGISPDISERMNLEATKAALSSAIADPEVLDKMGVSADQANKALDITSNRLALLGTAAQKVQQDTSLELAVISSRTAAEKTAADAQKAYTTTLRETGDSLLAAAQAEGVRSRALADANKTLLDAARGARDSANLAGLRPYERGRQQIQNEDRDLRRDTMIPSNDNFTGHAGQVGPFQPSASPMSAADRDLMIRTIYGEAGGEGAIGQAAVAEVIKNRVDAGTYGGSVHDVITAPKQFSVWNPGDPAGALANGLSSNSASYQKIAAIVDSVMAGKVADMTGGARNYYNPKMASPAWGDRLGQTGDVTIGNHRFVGGASGGQPSPSGLADQTTSDKLHAFDVEQIDAPLRAANDQLTAQTALLASNTATWGKSTSAIAAAAEKQQLISQYQQAGVPITDELMQRIDSVSAGYGNLAKQSADAQKQQQALVGAMDEVRGGAKDGLGTFVGDLTKGKSASDALRDSLTHVLDRILSLSESSIVDGLLGKSGTVGGSSPGIFGGLLSSAFGGIGSLFKAPSIASSYSAAAASASPDLFGPGFADGGVMTKFGPLQLNRYANGGVATKPQVAMYGEGKTPEAYVPLPDGRSIPVNMNVPSFVQNGGGQQAAQSQAVSITHAPVIHMTPANGVTPDQLKQVLTQNNRDFQRNILAKVTDAQNRYG